MHVLCTHCQAVVVVRCLYNVEDLTRAFWRCDGAINTVAPLRYGVHYAFAAHSLQLEVARTLAEFLNEFWAIFSARSTRCKGRTTTWCKVKRSVPGRQKVAARLAFSWCRSRSFHVPRC